MDPHLNQQTTLNQTRNIPPNKRRRTRKTNATPKIRKLPLHKLVETNKNTPQIKKTKKRDPQTKPQTPRPQKHAVKHHIKTSERTRTMIVNKQPKRSQQLLLVQEKLCFNLQTRRLDERTIKIALGRVNEQVVVVIVEEAD